MTVILTHNGPHLPGLASDSWTCLLHIFQCYAFFSIIVIYFYTSTSHNMLFLLVLYVWLQPVRSLQCCHIFEIEFLCDKTSLIYCFCLITRFTAPKPFIFLHLHFTSFPWCLHRLWHYINHFLLFLVFIKRFRSGNSALIHIQHMRCVVNLWCCRGIIGSMVSSVFEN